MERFAASSAALVFGLFVATGAARAQIVAEPAAPYPDPSLFARGFFVQGEAGVAIPIGEAGKALSPGPAAGVVVGYELWRFLAVQVRGVGSSHGVDVAGGPQVAQLFQIMQAAGELRLSLPLGAWSIFAQGGAGRARFSSNVLATAGITDPGVRSSPTFGGGGGIDYHTRSRHFACGIAGGFTSMPKLAAGGTVNAGLYLRYSL